MNINVASTKDIYLLNKLINNAYRGEESRKGWTTETDLLDGIRTDEQSLRELISKPGAVIIKYCDDKDHLLGCVYLEKIKNKIYLGMLTVSPEEQGKGIGKMLLSFAEKYAKEKKCNLVEMTVISVRTELINWYEKKGYRTTGEKRPFPSDIKFGIPKMPLEFVVLQKELNSL